MSNKTSDKNVANIEDDVRLIKRYLEDSSYKESDSDFFKNGGWEIIDLEIPRAMENILAELEQKDKRIKELEEELEKANRQLDLDYVEENFIPKQQVKGKLKELKIERDKIYKEFIESNRLDKQLHVQGIYLDAQIIILQELLEGEK